MNSNLFQPSIYNSGLTYVVLCVTRSERRVRLLSVRVSCSGDKRDGFVVARAVMARAFAKCYYKPARNDSANTTLARVKAPQLGRGVLPDTTLASVSSYRLSPPAGGSIFMLLQILRESNMNGGPFFLT